MYWTGNYQTVELNLTKEQAECSHSGDCEDDVRRVMEIPAVKRQLKKINPKQLKRALHEYGAWTKKELSNHNDNLMRITWIAAGDIREGNRR